MVAEARAHGDPWWRAVNTVASKSPLGLKRLPSAPSTECQALGCVRPFLLSSS